MSSKTKTRNETHDSKLDQGRSVLCKLFMVGKYEHDNIVTTMQHGVAVNKKPCRVNSSTYHTDTTIMSKQLMKSPYLPENVPVLSKLKNTTVGITSDEHFILMITD